jgi:hypothetical protein
MFIFYILLSCILLYLSITITSLIKRKFIFQRFEHIHSILEQSKITAFNKIFGDKILVQKSSGFKINSKELEIIQREFLNFVFLSCGTKILKDLKYIYGDLDSLSIILLNQLSQKIIAVESDIDKYQNTE